MGFTAISIFPIQFFFGSVCPPGSPRHRMTYVRSSYQDLLGLRRSFSSWKGPFDFLFLDRCQKLFNSLFSILSSTVTTTSISLRISPLLDLCSLRLGQFISTVKIFLLITVFIVPYIPHSYGTKTDSTIACRYVLWFSWV